MGLNKEVFIVAKSVSVVDPYDDSDPDVIQLPVDGSFVDVLSVDVCVKNSKRTQVSLDSFAQIAMTGGDGAGGATLLSVTYEILRSNTILATINNTMDYASVNLGRHTNFPNFPVVDEEPNVGINTYILRCSSGGGPNVASRSLKAIVITL
ncbi:hypothetical protein [Chengkuizengella axinellae]|uniref:Uncharacterized protein n=1 Tax=Chengkuizengella axinellae TaxID=3064388 RepID=A0ABT9IV60_9BACL|nr:hypothetical protein [Chengkuizengella sp. 2205SS18-9]MDP5273244.1 hypothetical protein [Chengkuizengella sp. 2205SS18-9]